MPFVPNTNPEQKTPETVIDKAPEKTPEKAPEKPNKPAPEPAKPEVKLVESFGLFYNPETKRFQDADGKEVSEFTFEDVKILEGFTGLFLTPNHAQYATAETAETIISWLKTLPELRSATLREFQMGGIFFESVPQRHVEVVAHNGRAIVHNIGLIAISIARSGDFEAGKERAKDAILTAFLND